MIPKFRAWLKEDKKMVDVYCIWFAENYIGYIEKEGAVTTLHELDFDEVVLMQSTGLTDKNGVEIYEGDIVVEKEGWIKGVVKFRDGCFGVEILTFTNVDNKQAFWSFPAYVDIEVIGNIHQHPELLEEG